MWRKSASKTSSPITTENSTKTILDDETSSLKASENLESSETIENSEISTDDKKSGADDDKKSTIGDEDSIIDDKESVIDEKQTAVVGKESIANDKANANDKEATVVDKKSVEEENKTLEDIVITPDPPEVKRGRPRNSTPISPITKKEINTNEDSKVENSELDDKNSTDDNKSSDSPARVYRKRVFTKSAIVTRKSALDASKTNSPQLIDSGRSMRGRRNSTGKLENKKASEIDAKKSDADFVIKKPEIEVKKRGRKSLHSTTTSEPGTPIKRKREDSNKSEDEHIQKALKLEDENDINKEDDENDEKLNNNEEEMKKVGEKNELKIKKEMVDDEVDNLKSDDKEDVSVKEDEIIPEIKAETSEINTRKKRGGRKTKKLEIYQTIERRRSDRKPVKATLKAPVLKRTTKRRKLKTEEVENVEKEDDAATDVSMWDDSKADLESNVSDLAVEPLTVDTTNTEEKENLCSSTADCIKENLEKESEKAASLSPEMISEGVSEISVKQFYKKPEFLENNLGIEKDPKLGGIVQEVENVETSKKDDTNESETISEIDNNKTDEIENIDIKSQNIENESNESSQDGALVIDEESMNESISTEQSLENKRKQNTKCYAKKDKKTKKCVTDLKKEKIADKQESIQEDADEKLEIEVDEKENVETEKNNNKSKTSIKDDLKENMEIDIAEIQSSSKTEDKIKTKSDKKILTKAVLEQAIENSMKESNLKLKNDKKLNEILAAECNSGLKENSTEIKMNLLEENIESKIPINEICKNRKSMQVDNNAVIEDKNHSVRVQTMEERMLTELPDLEKSIEEEISQFKICKISRTSEDDDSRMHLVETPETMRQKERHLKSLGLLTHKAAVQAKIDKQRRKKLLQLNKKQTKNIQDTGDAVYSIKHNRQSLSSGDSKRKSNSANNTSGTTTSGNNGGRQSLKITFQKGRGRPNDRSSGSGPQPNQNIEETYYTIQNEIEGGQNVDAVSHGRKSYNRNNNTIDVQSESSDSNGKKDGKEKILIPEKASSFGIHPGRLCQDQCYYCGGKFGLYDTPCHVAQLKSTERQQKILANEEKLTIDNCLCDACFRHVDKRANVPSYRKRLEQAALENESNTSSQSLNESNLNDDNNHANKICFVPDCMNQASHHLKKKCIRKSIKKILPNFDASSLGGITPMCNQHYDAILQYLGCALCKRRLGKNHMYHIQEAEKLERLLLDNNIPVQVGNSSAICKLCRYFTNLLVKPSTSSKAQKSEFVRSYRKRLLQFHNVQTDDDGSADEIDDDNGNKYKDKKSKNSSLDISDNLDLTTSGHMTLDNDVMVGYDVPIISDDSREPPSPDDDLASKLKQILQGDKSDLSTNKGDNISLVLKSNPNISMRELFPGEEEMGLHMNIPFNSSGSLRTPEGWTRVQTSLQYDEPTRRLWEDLQKPYGNVSSFLRHLILLEKYYRNGDLVLSHNASSNASVYSKTVQNRLRSYDNKVPSTSTSKSSGSRSSTSLSIVDNSKQPNYPITITTKPKSQPQSNVQSFSNSNISNKINLNANKNAIEILPITATKTFDAKQQKLLAAANKLIGNIDFSTNNSNQDNLNQKSSESPNNINPNIPPELISIKNRQAMMSATMGKQQQQQRNQLNSQPSGSNKASSSKHNIIVLRDTLTPAERQNSKNWRPNLMPVSSASLNQTGPLYETVDGRKLPALVQVQSGGQPYLISIHDYNRMCIIRREKILRDKMLKAGKLNKSKQQQQSQQHQQQPQHSATPQNKVPNIPNKILEQNSLFAVTGNNSNRNLPGNSISSNPVESSNRKKQTLHQQQQNQMANLKQSTSTASSNFVPILPKTVQQQLTQQNHIQILPTTATSTLSSNNMQPMTLTPAFITNSVSILPPIPNVMNLAVQSLATTPVTSVFNTSSPSTSAASLNPYLKTIQSFNHQQQQNFLQQNFLQMHKAATANMNALNPLILDNTLLSKIPKSLTVIPQQKSQSQQGRSSIEDLTSA